MHSLLLPQVHFPKAGLVASWGGRCFLRFLWIFLSHHHTDFIPHAVVFLACSPIRGELSVAARTDGLHSFLCLCSIPLRKGSNWMGLQTSRKLLSRWGSQVSEEKDKPLLSTYLISGPKTVRGALLPCPHPLSPSNHPTWKGKNLEPGHLGRMSCPRTQWSNWVYVLSLGPQTFPSTLLP